MDVCMDGGIMDGWIVIQTLLVPVFPTVVGRSDQQGAVMHLPSCESPSKRQKNIGKMARALTEDQLAGDVFTSLQVKMEKRREVRSPPHPSVILEASIRF